MPCLLVMQLVKHGKLDLNADVNAYLDFRIPDTYPQPITLRHLLTHTAGFEDLYLDFLTLEAEDQPPPGAWLASHVPGRVRPPGEVAAYSNYGAALDGYIVARVSGQSYDQYIQEHIFNEIRTPDLRTTEDVSWKLQRLSGVRGT